MPYRRTIAASAPSCSAMLSLALAQGTMTGAAGNWAVHAAAKAGCPGIALQIQRDGENLKGFAETGDMAGTSRLSGTIDAKGQFSLPRPRLTARVVLREPSPARATRPTAGFWHIKGSVLYRWSAEDRDLRALPRLVPLEVEARNVSAA
jgi:hypothetical protein